MKVNFSKNKNINFAFLKSIDGDLDLVSQILDARDPELKDDEGNPCDDVIFKVNGIEVDFNNFVNAFVDHLDKLVELSALELLQEKYEKIMTPLQEIQEELEEQRDILLGCSD